MKNLHYLALLRGINVGGNNIIKMVALKACFEKIGLTDVKTYIQSGNVVFSAKEQDVVKLSTKIEKILSKTFSYKSRVVVISAERLEEIIAESPKGFGEEPTLYRYDVIFLKEPLTAKEAIKDLQPRDGVDTAHAGKHALYFSRLIAKASQSHLSRVIKLPSYQFMTIRNWNTTTRLRGLMEEEEVVKSILKASKEVRLKGKLDKLTERLMT